MDCGIKDSTVGLPRLEHYSRDDRFMATASSGSYDAEQVRLFVKNGADLGSNNVTSYHLGSDNNYTAIRNALTEIRKHIRKKPMLLWKNHCKVFLAPLPGLQGTIGGFRRKPSECVEAAPRFYPVIRHLTFKVLQHDLKNGNKTSCIYHPINWGGHLLSKILQDLELRTQGLLQRRTRIGLTTIPTELMASRVFQEWFPSALDGDMFGVNATVISDESSCFGRTREERDEMIVKGLIGIGMAFVWDSTQPGFRDIWEILSEKSNLIGANAVESNIIAWRRPKTFWRVGVDADVAAIQIRRIIKRVISDPRARLIDAEVDESSPKVLVVIARIRKHIFDQAIEECFLPSNIIPIFVPTKSYKITAVLFYPLCGRIFSIERRFGLKNYRPPEPYRLPTQITEASIRKTRPVIEKASKVAGVAPEMLLNCNYN